MWSTACEFIINFQLRTSLLEKSNIPFCVKMFEKKIIAHISVIFSVDKYLPEIGVTYILTPVHVACAVQ